MDGSLLIHPGYQFGAVCCGTTRTPAMAVAGCVFAGDNVDQVADDYGLTRLQVLTACWWLVDDAQRQHRPSASERRVIEAWGHWFDMASRILGGHQPGPLNDPPEAT